MTGKHLAVSLLASCLAPGIAFGFIQERTPSCLADPNLSCVPVRWNLTAVQPNISGGMVEYVVNKRGSEDLLIGDAVAAVEAAFEAWRGANGSVVDFVRLADPSPLSTGTTPNREDQVNIIFWEEDPRDVWNIPDFAFALVIRRADGTTGELLDVDVVVNGHQYRWTTQADGNFTSKTGPADVQEALTKAVGEFIGLNPVPTSGSVMELRDYPGNTSKRILTQDELAAALDIYSPTPDPAVMSISGQVTRSSAGVFGVYVAAFQNGVPVVGAVTDPNGNYSIRRLPSVATSYTVRVVTMKRPDVTVSPFFSTLDNDFLSEAYLDAATDPATSVTTVPDTDVPMIDLDVAAADTLDPWEPDDDPNFATIIPTDGTLQIHHSFPAGDTDVVQFSATAGRLYVIETSNLGTGGGDSDTILTLMNPGFTPIEINDDRNLKQTSRASRIVFRASVSGTHYVEAVQKVAGVEGSGTAYDISVTDRGATAPTPTVSSVTPSQGSEAGGYQRSVEGSGFLPGASVSFGGAPGTEVDVADPNRLFVTVPAGAPGSVDVTVTNDGGTPSAPLVGGFTYIGDITTLGTYVDATFAAFGTFPGNSDAVAWTDYDADLDLDIYLTNDLAAELWRNNSDLTFTDVRTSSGIVAGGGANPESVAWGDYNNDGCIDVYKVNSIVAANNVLLRNNCDGTFTDVTSTAGVAGRANGRSRDAAWADFDNDGWLDIFVAQAFDGRTDSHIDFLFHNEGGNPPTFTDKTFDAGVDDPFLLNGLSAAFGDYTGNGAPDLFVGNAGSGNDFLWQNQANRNDALVVQLVGTISNRLGIGARVSVTADLDGSGPAPAMTQTKEMIGGSKGQNPVELQFGLGRGDVETQQVDEVTVFWPASGLTSGPFFNLSANQILTVFEGAPGISVTSVAPSSGPTAGGTPVVITGMNFEPNATVTFGGTTVTPGTVLGNRITATTPGHAAGAVDVTVTNPSRAVGDPFREATLPNGFVYVSGDPLDSLECFDSVNTTCVWASVPGATAYDVIRGDLGSLQIVGGTQVSLGAVTCVENESTDTTTAPNHRDSASPAAGEGFFYLFRVSGGDYGTSSSGLPRVPGTGTCP